MRTLRVVCPLLIVCLFCISVAAQQAGPVAPSPPTTSGPQANAIIQRSLLVLTGGVPISDVTLTGTARRIAGSDDETGTATLKANTSGDSRVDLALPSGNRSEIRNHSAVPVAGSLPASLPTSVAQAPQPAGVWSGPDGTPHGMANQNVMTDATWFFPAATLTRVLSSNTYTLTYIGPEDLNGQPVTHLEVFQLPQPAMNAPQQTSFLIRHLSQMDLYLNSNTLLPVSLSFNIHPDDDPGIDIPTEIQFSDYTPVNGIPVAFHLQKYVNNSLVLDLNLNSVTVNAGVTPASFEIQ